MPSAEVVQAANNEQVSGEATSQSGAVGLLSQLKNLGYQLTTLGDRDTLVCNRELDRCICVRPLPCNASSECPRLDTVTTAFVDAMNHPPAGHRVYCEHAEAGSCGSNSYFQFRGDIYRDETQWFDADKRLVASYARSDHQAYCDGRSRILVSGELPDCEPTLRTTLYCGDARTVPSPRNLIRNDLRSPSAQPD